MFSADWDFGKAALRLKVRGSIVLPAYSGAPTTLEENHLLFLDGEEIVTVLMS